MGEDVETVVTENMEEEDEIVGEDMEGTEEVENNHLALSLQRGPRSQEWRINDVDLKGDGSAPVQDENRKCLEGESL